ncbi:MAG: hypothetical protein HY865_15995 [Chloroflexi bacterium]|nr:hypothetical protein [Chloroflexota bacterium]
MAYQLAAVLFTLSSITFATITYTIIHAYLRHKKGGVIPENVKWISLFSGIILSVLFSFGVMFWLVKQTEDVFKQFDETEFIKTHYAGVDCSSLKGSVFRANDDMSRSAQSVCLAERAWFENNINFCYHTGNPNNNCLTWMAIKLGDLKICEMQKPYYDPDSSFFDVGFGGLILEEEKPRAWLYRCYWIYARMRDESAVCDLIPFARESSKQTECIKPSTDGDTYLEFKYAPIW